MFEARLRFEKLGRAAYISHLDLMKALQRAFLRAGLPVRYSQGFNPHIYLSILAPLSTGYQSEYELCDFDLLIDEPEGDELDRFNQTLPEGLRALELVRRERKVREIAACRWHILLKEADAAELAGWRDKPIEVERRSKRTTSVVDLGAMVREEQFIQTGPDVICDCVLPVGNESLNPAYVVEGLKQSGRLDREVRASYLRKALLDRDGRLFI